ncbi:uncharacterized protein LOC117100365, partial [Anneissia japonica]|uniref:uncharacterized protein LOC117100365 n=1 Tax=Anneissia japonica TaxID=1529436 RepID=UPI0014256F7A
SCIAEGPSGDRIRISDDGTTLVGGCALCECEAAQSTDYPLFWRRDSNPPLLSQRLAICDTSACQPDNPCSNTDPSLVFPSSRDVPPCTFGCLCFTNGDVGLCIDPAPCDVTNKCITPEFSCGCPTCPEVGNCVAMVGEFFYLINDDGPTTVGGCAVCECNPISNPIPFPGFWLPGNKPPT